MNSELKQRERISRSNLRYYTDIYVLELKENHDKFQDLLCSGGIRIESLSNTGHKRYRLQGVSQCW
jgi:hypothetical protein